MRDFLLSIVLTMAMTAVLFAGQFEPHEIKPGVSYYSDEYTTSNGVSGLGEEKNFEEVWQNYNYYEAIFDSNERIVTFKAYERGKIEFSETYHYDAEGNPTKKIVKKSDGSESVVNF